MTNTIWHKAVAFLSAHPKTSVIVSFVASVLVGHIL